MLDFDTIINQVKDRLVKKAAPSVDDGSVSANLDAVLASTEKLLAVNRGHAEPDERDSLVYRKVFTPDKLLSERINLDADRIKRNTIRRLSKTRNLQPVGTAHFDPYMLGLIVSNPLSSPLEETNPMSLVEQARRITAMGPGGIPSEELITEEANSNHPSEFGFVDSVSGPESKRIGVDVRAATGTKVGSDGLIYQRFRNARTGQHHWLSASDLHGKVLGLPD